MFFGTHKHSLDSKGRLIIPACYREDLGEKFLIMRGTESCLLVYPGSELKRFEEKFAALPTTDRRAQAYIRKTLSSMSQCEVDAQGRVLIPVELRKSVSLQKEAVIIGAYNRIEIWDSETWDRYSEATDENLDDIIEDMSRLGV